MRSFFSLKKRAILFAAVYIATSLPIGSATALSLDDAVDMALRNNFKIKLAQKKEAQSIVKLEAAKGRRLPSISVNSSLGLSEVDSQGSSRNNTNSVRLSVPIYTGGKNELTVARAEDDVMIGKLNMGRTQENVTSETITGYYAVLEAQKLMQVEAETVNNYQVHLDNVRNLYMAGSTPKVDVLRSEVELINSQQNFLKAQNTYDLAFSRLKNVIRSGQDEVLTLSDDALYEVFSASLEECIAYAYENRKDLLQAKVNIAQAEKDVGIASSDKLPQVSLSLGNSWDKQLVPSGDNHALTASVAASWNIFDGNVTKSNIKAAEMAVEEAMIALLQQMDEVDLEVRENYLSMREAEKRFNTTAAAVGKAQEDYYIAQEKYKAGEGIMLGIIDAQLALSTAKTNSIKAQYDYAVYKAKLENSMGRNEVNRDET